jgi:hypothetical protein
MAGKPESPTHAATMDVLNVGIILIGRQPETKK